MKKIFKKTGIVALTLVLVFNLQYALINYNIVNSPNAALAAYVSGNTTYCGNPGDTPQILAGTWYWQVADSAHPDYPNGYYVFYPDNHGQQCGAFSGDVTDIIPTGSAYQY